MTVGLTTPASMFCVKFWIHRLSSILPHVHMLISMRVFDPAHPDVGRIRQH